MTHSTLNPMLSPSPTDPHQQWLAATLKLRTELKFDTRREGENTFVVVEDPVRSKYFQIGTSEYEFLAALDGRRPTSEIVSTLNANGRKKITEEQAVTISQWLVQSNLIISDTLDATNRIKTQLKAVNSQAWMSKINPISFKVTLFNPNHLLSVAHRWFDWLFSKWFFIAWIMVCVWALKIGFSQWTELKTASQGILSGTSWMSLLVFWLLLKVVHEFAHGISCKRYGGEVPEAGVLFLLFTPMAFVNVTSMWRFSNRWQRIVVAAAGMYIELFISFIALIVWSHATGLTADIAYNVFLMSSITTVLFNANPLMRFDGYFILSDLVKIPNLYTKGTGWFGDRLKHVLLGTPKTPNLFATHETRIVKCYGSLAFFWKISISIGLIIAASVMFNGVGLLLGALGIVLWFGLPLMKQYQLHCAADARRPFSRGRTLISAAVASLVVVALFWILKAPATKSAPALVRFADETLLRSAADGFVDEVLIASGDRVTQGQPLLRLRNDDLALELDSLIDEVKAVTIEERIYRQQKELVLASVEAEKLAGLRKQLAEKREQAQGLVVRSPLTGFAWRRNLHHLPGSFVRRGDPLLTVAQRETKEIVVSVDQRDFDSIAHNQHQPLRIVLPGVETFASNIDRVDPRASNMPMHQTLCADAGGPLPLKPAPRGSHSDPDQTMVLLSPRFEVLVSLNAPIGQRLHSGQRGRAFFSAATQSLGSYLFIAVEDWIKTKIEQATLSAP